jgi:DNA topoisomerase IB
VNEPLPAFDFAQAAGLLNKNDIAIFVEKFLFCSSIEDTMSTVKADVTALLKNLPDTCSYEDVQYQLYVIEKVRHSKELASKSQTLSQEDVENRLDKWL